jgi:glycosidase
MLRFILSFVLLLSFNFQNYANESNENLASVPQWAKEAVWYQIFPERFWNGDRNNDPTLKDMKGGWPYFQPDSWQIHPWTSDWYKLQPWESNIDWHKHFSWAKEGEPNFYAAAGLRRYGGDLQGVLDKLDYLRELGINAIYFNPLFESPSHHKYDATMYHHIDNNFGPNPEKDRMIWEQEDPGDPATWQWTTADSQFLAFLQECHKRNIRVIIDGVFNHVGYTFWAFQDVIKNQQNSKFKDWFIIKSWDDPATPENEFEYQGWNGVRDLPEIVEDENGLAQGPRQHVKSVVQRWMDPNGDGDPSDGIDGWRLDVAEKVNINFWKDFRKWVKGINPDAYITGEIWWEDWQNNKMFNAAPWLQGDAFDAVMNYRWGRAAMQFVIDDTNKITAQGFVDSINAILQDYPRGNIYVLQNMVGSHDMERLASQTVNPDRWPDHGGSPSQNPDFNVKKPNEIERLKQKLIVGMQMTSPGAPMIYYGDEAGMWGGDDPDCRKPMVWPDLEYEPEVSHPFGKQRPKDEVKFEKDIYEWYKKLITIRRENPTLALGDIEFFLVDNSKSILGYKRSYNGQTLVILLNNSNRTQILQNIDFQSLSRNNLTDLITGEKTTGRDNKFNIFLNAYRIVILE